MGGLLTSNQSEQTALFLLSTATYVHKQVVAGYWQCLRVKAALIKMLAKPVEAFFMALQSRFTPHYLFVLHSVLKLGI